MALHFPSEQFPTFQPLRRFQQLSGETYVGVHVLDKLQSAALIPHNKMPRTSVRRHTAEDWLHVNARVIVREMSYSVTSMNPDTGTSYNTLIAGSL